jgi:hypothetical protein
VAKKKTKLKSYGFHYTWKEILPKSEIVIVKAADLDEARELVREKVKVLYPDVKLGCHWITMPEDFERNPPRGSYAASCRAQRKNSRIPSRIIIMGMVLVIVMILLTSCNVDRFIQGSRNFRKKITQYEQRLTGAKYYYLQPVPSNSDTDK